MRDIAAVKVKANAHYTCQECGATELIQAHHQIPGDDNSLIVLCAECHSKKHPDLPKALFFNKRNQPYWHNKSASSIARELGVHPRTVIRAAKRLEVLPGELHNIDDWRIRVAAAKRTKPKIKKENALQTTCPRDQKTNMPTVKVKVDNESGLGYFPKSIRDDGFIGELEGIANALTFTLIRPGTNLRDIEESLEIVLRDLRLRRKQVES